MNDQPSIPANMAQGLRTHLTLDPAGIELHAAIMHVVYAHAKNPSPIGDAAHHKQAVEYINHFARGCRVDRQTADANSATYMLSHARRPKPIVIRMNIGKPWYACLEVLINTTWVRVDLRSFDVVLPAD